MSQPTRILCVDDEKNVLRSLERIFLDDDYDILTAQSGEEGLELLETAEEVQVVISDYRMPGMNGVDFLREVFKLRPESIRIVLSGYADTAAVVAAINEGKIYKFIPKPWNDDELRFTVAKAIEAFTIQRQNWQLAEELRLKNDELKELNGQLERLVEKRTAELVLQNRALVQARNVLENLPVGVLGIATDGTVVQVNREAAELLGIPPEHLLGETISHALPEEIRGLLTGSAPPGFRSALVNGREVQVKGVALVEEGKVGVVLTLVDHVAVCLAGQATGGTAGPQGENR